MLKKLIVQASHYSSAGILTTLAGLISFPIITRLLTVGEYGLLSLISATITLIAGVGKAGMQFSIVRFYADLDTSGMSYTRKQFFCTSVLGMIGIGGLVTMVWAIGVLLVPKPWWSDTQLRLLLCMVSVLIFTDILTSLGSSFLQAQQRSVLLSTFRVLKRYALLGLTVFFLVYIAQNLIGFYSAYIIAETGAVCILAWIVLRDFQLRWRDFDRALFRSMLLYGVPLVGNELAAILLGLGDRYILQWFLGSPAVGVYAAAYAVCGYVQAIFITALFQAIRPIYLRLWAEKGEAETRAFIQRCLYFYLMLGLPLIAGVSVVGPDLLVLLASEKYSSDSAVIPYVIAGMLAFGTISMVGAGLHIQKQGLTLMVITLIAAASNVLLNFLLIPRLGIQGAAIATLFSYLLMAFLVGIKGARILSISIPWFALTKFTLLSVLMYLVLQQIELDAKLTTLFIRVICGVVLYGVLLLASDAAARKELGVLLGKVEEFRRAKRP